jgi:tyrosine-protein phosphatase YwqE
MDLHSHLIPGIDDGVQTLEESFNLISELKQRGYRKLITTPHIMWDCYRNTPDIILDGLDNIKNYCLQKGLNVSLDAAAEYFMDEHFFSMLQNKEKMLTLPGNRLLVELPYTTPLMNTSELLFSVIEHGYQPVLAHPERYKYFHNKVDTYNKFVDQGCELQLNALSITGQYGEGVRKASLHLLKEGLISFLGTDAHKIEHVRALDKVSDYELLMEYPFKNPLLIENVVG